MKTHIPAAFLLHMYFRVPIHGFDSLLDFMVIETTLPHILYGIHMRLLLFELISKGFSQLMEPICRYPLVLFEWHREITVPLSKPELLNMAEK